MSAEKKLKTLENGSTTAALDSDNSMKQSRRKHTRSPYGKWKPHEENFLAIFSKVKSSKDNPTFSSMEEMREALDNISVLKDNSFDIKMVCNKREFYLTHVGCNSSKFCFTLLSDKREVLPARQNARKEQDITKYAETKLQFYDYTQNDHKIRGYSTAELNWVMWWTEEVFWDQLPSLLGDPVENANIVHQDPIPRTVSL
jgi:hypothetical protein